MTLKVDRKQDLYFVSLLETCHSERLFVVPSFKETNANLQISNKEWWPWNHGLL